MKKIINVIGIILSIVLVFGLTACGNKEKKNNEEKAKVNLEDISNKLDSLSSEDFNLQNVATLIDQTDYFENLSYIYYYNFESILGLDSSNIEEASIRMNMQDKTMYMILKPSQNGDIVKEQINKYFNSIEAESELVKNRLETEYQGYLIYIVSNNNEEVLNIIKSAKVPMFESYMNLSGEMIEYTLNIAPTQYNDILVKMALMNNSNIFIMVRPNEEEKENVKSTIDIYLSDYEKELEINKEEFPEQYEILKNRKYEEYEGYLIWVVSTDNDKVLKAVKK